MNKYIFCLCTDMQYVFYYTMFPACLCLKHAVDSWNTLSLIHSHTSSRLLTPRDTTPNENMVLALKKLGPMGVTKHRISDYKGEHQKPWWRVYRVLCEWEAGAFRLARSGIWREAEVSERIYTLKSEGWSGVEWAVGAETKQCSREYSHTPLNSGGYVLRNASLGDFVLVWTS